MTRVIKVRAWLPAIKKMTYAHTLEELTRWDVPEWADNTVEWLEYTGLPDKNGVDIYDGDIVSFFDAHSQSQRIGVVEWNEAESAFKAHAGNLSFPLWIITHSDEWIENKCEVIGNIYENPHLLESEAQA